MDGLWRVQRLPPDHSRPIACSHCVGTWAPSIASIARVYMHESMYIKVGAPGEASPCKADYISEGCREFVTKVRFPVDGARMPISATRVHTRCVRRASVSAALQLRDARMLRRRVSCFINK